MPLALVTTPGDATANAYATLAQVDEVAAEVYPVPAWSSLADADTRARAVVAATRHLDQLHWVGSRVDAVQALEWPRVGAPTPTGDSFPTDAIPAPVSRACALLAMYLIAQGEDAFTPGPSGLTSFSLGGSFSASISPGTGSTSPGQTYLATVIRPLLRGLVRSAQPRAVRG